jgi:hypothetical protein
MRLFYSNRLPDGCVRVVVPGRIEDGVCSSLLIRGKPWNLSKKFSFFVSALRDGHFPSARYGLHRLAWHEDGKLSGAVVGAKADGDYLGQPVRQLAAIDCRFGAIGGDPRRGKVQRGII